MSTQITNKQVKIVSNVNFNNKEIENAKIDGSKNQITNLPNKLIAGENITIDKDGYFWTDFGGENNNNLKLLNPIPNFSSIRIIFKASCVDLYSEDNVLLCNKNKEQYIGIDDGPLMPSIYNIEAQEEWTTGQVPIKEKTNYWFCLDSSDGQTFTYYTIEDNNYTLNTLPQLSEWEEQCSINDNFFAEQEFYIGYNPFSQEEYWKGNIYECQINIDDNVWFNLSTAQEGVDYENNGCTYVGKITEPIINAKDTKYSSGENIHINGNGNHINFAGYNYVVYDFTHLQGNDIDLQNCLVSDNSLVFKNGQLLRRGIHYDFQPNMAGEYIEDIDRIEQTSFVYFNTALQNDDKIKIINGLSPRQYKGINGESFDTGHNLNSNMLVFKNGVLLSGIGCWYRDEENDNVIHFETPLTETDLITIVPTYTTKVWYIHLYSEDMEDGNKIDTNMDLNENVLVWLNNVLLTETIDYNIIDEHIIEFKVPIADNSLVSVSNPSVNSIYNAIADKQDSLPEMRGNEGKILSNNGNSFKWVQQFEDGIYHPTNGDELYAILENEPGFSKTIDFSNFDFSTFYRDGYTINEKAFTIRNFGMGSNWGAWQFNWMKSPLFTLNNGATLYFQNLVINVQDWHCDPSNDQDKNTAPVLRASNGSHISITNGGMININNVTGINKYVAIELNNSNTNMQNFGIIINSNDKNRPNNTDSLTCAIECNGFSYNENNFDRVGFDISGNTTEKYGIKYNDDLGGFIKIGGGGFNVDGGNGYSIYCSNKTILELNFVNVGKIDGMPITVKQLSPNTDYYKDDIIEINGKLYKVIQDFNSNDYDDIEDGYGRVYEDFWTINVTGTMYSIEDPNGRIGSYETTDSGYRAKGLILNSENWNLPISDEHLTATNAKDAIKELAANSGGGSTYNAGPGIYIENNEIGINKNTAFYNHLYINSKDDNIQDSDISFDKNTFFTYTGGADNNFYNFIYMNGTWNLRIMDYSIDPWDWDYIGEVDLADYGITYNGTPFENGWFILAGNYLTGKTSFTVIMLSFSNVFLNGILLTEDLDFTRIDNTITFINYTLKSTDRIQVI